MRFCLYTHALETVVNKWQCDFRGFVEFTVLSIIPNNHDDFEFYQLGLLLYTEDPEDITCIDSSTLVSECWVDSGCVLVAQISEDEDTAAIWAPSRVHSLHEDDEEFDIIESSSDFLDCNGWVGFKIADDFRDLNCDFQIQIDASPEA